MNQTLAVPAARVTRLSWTLRPAAAALSESANAEAWNRLNASHTNLPFLDAHAVLNALEVFGNGRERLLSAQAGGQTMAMLVLQPQGRLRWSTFQPSQIPLGCWLASPEIDLTELSESLLRGPLWPALAITLTQIDPRHSPRPLESAVAETADYIDTAWVDVEGTFDDYWSARGKNLRQNMRKQRNKLASDGVCTEMKVWTERSEVAACLSRYGAMESAGWKAGRGTAIASDNDQGRFYRGLFEQAAVRDETVFYEYLFDNRSVAMNLCLKRGTTLVVLKTTYDETTPKALSPAFLLREEELQRWFAEGQLKRIEYYGRVMDWHTKLTEQQRTLYHLTVFRFGWLKRLAQRRRNARPVDAERECLVESAS